MSFPRRLALAYVAAIVVLSSVSVAYEWISPIDTPEGPWDWFHDVGLQYGKLGVSHHVPQQGIEAVEADGGRWILAVYSPRFVPIPFYSGAGPDSGGGFVAIWFVGCIACALHMAFVRGLEQKRRAEAGGR